MWVPMDRRIFVDFGRQYVIWMLLLSVVHRFWTVMGYKMGDVLVIMEYVWQGDVVYIM